jgi:hypothetical protein
MLRTRETPSPLRGWPEGPAIEARGLTMRRFRWERAA